MASNHLESLRKGNAAKPFQSQLVPHLEFIREQRAARVPYAQIAAALRGRFGVTISPSSIHSFVKARARKRDVYTIVSAAPAACTPNREPTVHAADPIERLRAETTRGKSRTGTDWTFYDPKRPLQKLSHQK